MAYDEGHAEILRDHLASLPGVIEKRMFGGLCFMLNGNMLCGSLLETCLRNNLYTIVYRLPYSPFVGY